MPAWSLRRAVALPASIPLRALLGAGLLVLSSGCSSPDPAPGCVEGLDLACAPLYSPTFDNVFTRTLQPTCAQAGASCHAAEGKQGGLAFDDPDSAYAELVGSASKQGVVVPGDPSCSALVERLETAEASRRMPPGNPLSAAERCAIVQWIHDGAKR